MTDQNIDQPLMTPEEAWKILLLAKEAGSEKLFLLFKAGLVDDKTKEKIPWSFTDIRFLKKVQELKTALAAEFKIQNETLVPQIAEDSVTKMFSSEELGRIGAGIDKIRQQEQENRKILSEHKEALVNAYIKNIKEQVGLSPDQASAIETSVSKAIEHALETGSQSKIVEQIALAATEANIPGEIASSAASNIDVSSETVEAAQKLARLSKTAEIALSVGEDIDAATVIDRCLTKPEIVDQCLANPDLDPTMVISKFEGEIQAMQAVKTFNLSPEVEQQVRGVWDDPAKRTAATQQAMESATKGTVRFTKEMSDAVAGPGGKKLFDDVVTAVLGKSIEGISASGFIGDHRLITTPETEGLIKEKIQLMEESLGQRVAAQKTKQIAPRSIFRKETVDPEVRKIWEQQIQNGIFMYLQTASIKASANAPEYFHYFILTGSDLWRTIIGRSTQAVAHKTLEKGVEKATAAGATTALKAVGVTGGLLAPAIAFFSLVGGKIVSFVWGGIKGIASLLQFGEIARGITGGGPSSERRRGDPSMMLAIAIVAIVLLVAFPIIGMFSFTSLREVASTAAVVAEKKEMTGGVPSETGESAWPTNTAASPKTVSVVIPPPIKICDSKTGKICVEFKPGEAGKGDSNCGSGTESSDFTEAEWAMVQNALDILSQSPTFMSYVNNGAPITISRNRTDYGGGCFLYGNAPRIVLYNDAFSSPSAMLYTLAHELGHAIAHTNPDLLNSFYSSGIIDSEGYLPSYPNEKSQSEDFAETLGMYAHYLDSSRYGNYPNAFPNHFAFAQQVFGGVTIKSSP